MKIRIGIAAVILLLGSARTASAVQIPQVAPEVRTRAQNLADQPLKTEYQYIMKAYRNLEDVLVLENDGENVAYEDRREGQTYIQMVDGTRTWPRQEGKLIEVDGRQVIEKTEATAFRFWQKDGATLAEWTFAAGPARKYLWTEDAQKEIIYDMMESGQLRINNIIENTHRRPYSVLPFIPSIHVKTLTADKMKEEQVVENEPGKFLYTARDGESTIEFEATNHANPIAIRRVAGPLPGEESSETIYEGEQEFEGFLMPTAVETNKYDKDHHKKVSNRASDIRISRITDEEFAAIEEEYRNIKRE